MCDLCLKQAEPTVDDAADPPAAVRGGDTPAIESNSEDWEPSDAMNDSASVCCFKYDLFVCVWIVCVYWYVTVLFGFLQP